MGWAEAAGSAHRPAAAFAHPGVTVTFTPSLPGAGGAPRPGESRTGEPPAHVLAGLAARSGPVAD